MTKKRVSTYIEMSSYERVEEAANRKGLSVGAFMKMAAIEKAIKILEESDTIRIDQIKLSDTEQG